MDMTIKTAEYRPCFVKRKGGDRKALFHRWADTAQIRDALMAGMTSGQLREVFAVVEYEDGTVEKCYPDQIVFCDNLYKRYYWPEENDDGKN